MRLIQNKINLTAEQRLLDWRESFNVGDFRKASAAYRDLLAVPDDAAAAPLDQVRKEYRQALDSLAESWRKACANQDKVEMERARERAIEIVPEESIARDFLAQTGSCPTKT